MASIHGLLIIFGFNNSREFSGAFPRVRKKLTGVKGFDPNAFSQIL